MWRQIGERIMKKPIQKFRGTYISFAGICLFAILLIILSALINLPSVHPAMQLYGINKKSAFCSGNSSLDVV